MEDHSRVINNGNPSLKGGEISGGRPGGIFGETLWRYLSGVTPRIELPPDRSCNTAAPLPCLPEIRRAGVRRIALGRSAPVTEGLQTTRRNH